MMLCKLSMLVGAMHMLALATPFLAEEGTQPWTRQDEDIVVDAPTTPLGVVEPVNVDPLTDIHNTRLIGDLVNGATTPVGKSVLNILLGNAKAESEPNGYRAPGPLNSKRCRADTCCVWSHITNAMTSAFTGSRKQCNNLARAAIRLGFHDAGTWSSELAAQGQDFDGADGSIVLSGSEIGRKENRGLERIATQMKQWQRTFNVSMADLIQFGAIHAVVTCPLGPRIRFFAGRKDSRVPAVEGLLPSVTAPADELIKQFRAKTIEPHELAALLGAHSTSTQKFVDPTLAGRPQDSTPGIWDVKYYNETIQERPRRIFRLQSDVALAAHPSMKDEWMDFIDPVDGQDHWNSDYATAYTRLSLLGVNNINQMTECSHVLPAEIRRRPRFA
ncbi:ligninase h2 precursor like protein [Zymoseptoria brevis]|uniref:Peroxidase n=1 Tax=Zymoseptoria brevis TaxID=1047168 RepID=A0A0F4GA50_9PEZI|nr:ligninase h2 precursor like protein [Zymoseptoria brevis]